MLPLLAPPHTRSHECDLEQVSQPFCDSHLSSAGDSKAHRVIWSIEESGLTQTKRNSRAPRSKDMEGKVCLFHNSDPNSTLTVPMSSFFYLSAMCRNSAVPFILLFSYPHKDCTSRYRYSQGGKSKQRSNRRSNISAQPLFPPRQGFSVCRGEETLAS